ncbi:unnamed protein product [Durusdinium trenchii]|uniref:Aminotransferase class V domain-containing protein n=1 Tax=Durusdinium trenchii TaxID=1381693 RepID=A0ABP0LZL9_9DINO
MLCHGCYGFCLRFHFRAFSSPSVHPVELQQWRKGLKDWSSGGWLHMNAAGASPASQEVHDATSKMLQQERELGGWAASYEAEARYRQHGRDARQAAAELLGCDAEEIALTESAQSAWAKAFGCLDFRPGDRIFCWASEYAGNAVAFLQAKKKGAQLKILPMQADGTVDVQSLCRELESPSSSRSVVALTHVQTNSSIIQPAARVGEIAKRFNAIFLLDTCQSIGQLPVDVRSLNCDFACGTGRKWLRGPRGTGILYARKSALPMSKDGRLEHSDSVYKLVGEPLMIDHVAVSWTSSETYQLSPGARRFEMWESSPALHAGLAAAIDVCKSIEPYRIWKRSSFLAELLRQNLRQIPGLRIRDAPEEFAGQRCAIVTFEASQLGIASEFIKDVLAQRRITSSVAPPFHTFNEQEWARPSTLRLSPSYYNTEDEVYTVANAIREIVQNGAFEWSAAALLSDPFVFGATRKRPLTVTLFRSKVQQEAI